MFAFILAVTLAAGNEFYVAPQNHFDKAEMGSEAIFAGVAVCMDKTLREMPSAGETTAVVICGCLMDATRANMKAGKSGKDANATPEQAAKCHTLPSRPQQKAPPKPKAGT